MVVAFQPTAPLAVGVTSEWLETFAGTPAAGYSIGEMVELSFPSRRPSEFSFPVDQYHLLTARRLAPLIGVPSSIGHVAPQSTVSFATKRGEK